MYGIVKSIDVEKQMGVVASCAIDGGDLHFFVDPANPVAVGETVRYQEGVYARNLRVDKSLALEGERIR